MLSEIYRSLLGAHPGLGYLKLFQQAYQLGARATSLARLRDRTRFVCTGFAWDDDVAEFCRDFPERVPRSLVRLGNGCHLMLAEAEALEIQNEGGGLSFSITLDHSGVTKRASLPSSSGECGLSVSALQPPQGFLKEAVAALSWTRVMQEVDNRLNLYPIPVNLDGLTHDRGFECSYLDGLRSSPLEVLNWEGYQDREAQLVADYDEGDYFAAVTPSVNQPTDLYINDRHIAIEKVVPPSLSRSYRLRHPDLSMGMAQRLVPPGEAELSDGVVLVREGKAELTGMESFLLDRCQMRGTPRRVDFRSGPFRPIRVREIIFRDQKVPMPSLVVPVSQGVMLDPIRNLHWGPRQLIFTVYPPNLKTNSSGLALEMTPDLENWVLSLAPPSPIQ